MEQFPHSNLLQEPVQGKKIELQEVKNLLIETFNLEITADEMQDDIGLFQDGLNLDSIDALEIIVQIEKKYGVKIRPQQMQKSDFKNLKNLHQFINDL